MDVLSAHSAAQREKKYRTDRKGNVRVSPSGRGAGLAARDMLDSRTAFFLR